MTTEYSGSGDVSRSLELLWGLTERPSRGPKPGLTLDQIVRAAIVVADTEGLEALSMRRVAAELDVGTMSLYRYVPGKSELLDLMLDMVNEPDEHIDEPEKLGWRRVLEIGAGNAWRLYERHPWLLQVDYARPILGPNALMGVELTIRGMAGTRLTDQQKVMVLVVVYAFVAGLAREHVNVLRAERRTGVSDEDFWRAQEPVLHKVLTNDRFPTLANIDQDAFRFAYGDALKMGLKGLLDGLEAFIEGDDEGDR